MGTEVAFSTAVAEPPLLNPKPHLQLNVAQLLQLMKLGHVATENPRLLCLQSSQLPGAGLEAVPKPIPRPLFT